LVLNQSTDFKKTETRKNSKKSPITNCIENGKAWNESSWSFLLGDKSAASMTTIVAGQHVLP
jgi:hypothetical protein